jgi:biopolymer transport protein ExbD
MKRMLRVIAAFFLLTAILPAARGADVATPAVEAFNTLRIEPNKIVRWNGVKIDERTLLYLLKAAGKTNPKPEIHVEADRRARYDEVARIMSLAQKTGANIGFTGVSAK